MARTDSDEQAQQGGPIVLTAIIDCPSCEAPVDGIWTDDSISIEDMTEPPVAEQKCGACGANFTEEYPGWMFRSEAG